MKRSEPQLRIVRPRPNDFQRIDFTRLNSVRAVERVRQLRAVGLSDHIIGDLIGWPVDLVRRALGERP